MRVSRQITRCSVKMSYSLEIQGLEEEMKEIDWGWFREAKPEMLKMEQVRDALVDLQDRICKLEEQTDVPVRSIVRAEDKRILNSLVEEYPAAKRESAEERGNDE